MNKFHIKRDENGIQLFIQSEKIEAYFKQLSDNCKTSHEGVAIYYSDRVKVALANISDQFANRRASPMVSFRSAPLLQSDNVCVRYLTAVGIGEGCTINITNAIYSRDQLKKIAEGFKVAMDYLINDNHISTIFKFEIVQQEIVPEIVTITSPV